MNKNEKLVNEILDQIGGKENVSFVTHCMTRLRFNLKDESIVSLNDLKTVNGVLGAQFSGGQLQVIIGPKADSVYKDLCEIGGFKLQDSIDENLDKVKKPFSLKNLGNDVLDGVSGTLTQVIPVLVVAGLLKMIVALLGPGLLNLVPDTSDVIRVMTFAGDAGFYFLPIFVAYAGSKKFGSSPVISLLLASILFHPTLTAIVASGEQISIFGIPMLNTNYASTVIPMIITTFVLSYVEKWLRKFIPETFKSILVPLISVLIMLPLMLSVLGPLGNILGVYIGNFLIWLHELTGPVGVAIIGALFIPLVATGMHLTIITAAVVSIMTVGYDSTILVGSMTSIYASLALSLGLMIKAKDAETKSLALSCFAAQALGGVGEPTIFGIMFRYKKALLFAIIGTFAGGLYAGIMGAKIYFLAASNFLVTLGYSGGDGSSLLHGIIGTAITFIVTFALVMVFGFDDKKKVAS